MQGFLGNGLGSRCSSKLSCPQRSYKDTTEFHNRIPPEPLPVVLYSIVPLSILGVIPARYASSRFPGKALVSIAGKTMLQHVWERASQARYLTSVVIATDDERLRSAAAA